MAHFRPSRSCHTGCVGSPPWPEPRTIYRCSECGAAGAEVGGPVPGLRGVEHPRRGARRPAARGRRRSGRARRPCRCRSPRSTPPRGRRAPPHVGELDRVLGGGLVPGLGHAARRRAGHRQVHAAAPGAGRAGQAGARAASTSSAEESAQQVRLRAERLGALRAEPVARRPRRRCPHVARPHRRGRSPTCSSSTRSRPCYDPDARLGARARSRRCASAPHRLVREAKDAGDRHGARRPRHQGRRARRAPGARAHRRHRAVVRGRPPPRAAAAARRQAPLRLHRRARPVRDDRRAASAGVPDPSALFLADRRPGVAGLGGRARRSTGTARCSSRCRRSSRRSALPAPRRSAQGLDSGRLALLLAVLAAARSSMPFDEPRRLHARSSAACASSSPAPTSRSRSRSRSSLGGAPVPADLVACGEVGLGGELRQVAPDRRGGWPRRRGSGSGARSCRPARRSTLPGHRGAPRRARSSEARRARRAPTSLRDRRAVLSRRGRPGRRRRAR